MAPPQPCRSSSVAPSRRASICTSELPQKQGQRTPMKSIMNLSEIADRAEKYFPRSDQAQPPLALPGSGVKLDTKRPWREHVPVKNWRDNALI